MQGKHRCLPLEIRFYRTTNLDGVLLLLAIYLAVGAFAAVCKTDSTAKNNCVADQCDMVDGTEICTRCADTYVPINGRCVTATGNDKCKDTNGSANADQTCKQCLVWGAAGPLACGAAQNLTSKLAQFLAMSGGEGGSRLSTGLFFPVFRGMKSGRYWGLRWCSRCWRCRERGLSLCGSFPARWQG